MSLPSLSNIQIQHFENNSPDFGGCYSRDDLPPLQNRFYIVNLDDEKGPGTHWTLLYNCSPKVCYYFDSYGMPPPQEIVDAMSSSKKRCVFNDVDLQALGSEECGWWCMYIANALDRGQDFVSTIAQAHRHQTPDRYLQTWFQKK